MKRKFPIWAKTDCDECGGEFQVTRTMEKEFTGPVVCSDCEMYKRGFEDAMASTIYIPIKIFDHEGYRMLGVFTDKNKAQKLLDEAEFYDLKEMLEFKLNIPNEY